MDKVNKADIAQRVQELTVSSRATSTELYGNREQEILSAVLVALEGSGRETTADQIVAVLAKPRQRAIVAWESGAAGKELRQLLEMYRGRDEARWRADVAVLIESLSRRAN